jgi:hypothetical protein
MASLIMLGLVPAGANRLWPPACCRLFAPSLEMAVRSLSYFRRVRQLVVANSRVRFNIAVIILSNQHQH